jgi:outer membrane protein TolC
VLRFKLNKFFWMSMILLWLAFANITLAHAATSIFLSQLIHEAALNNPQIKAARDRWLATKYAIPQSRSLPDPKVDLGYIKMSGNNPMDVEPRREQMIGVSQEIPFPGKLIVRNKIAALDSKRARADYQATCFMVIAQLKRIYYDLYFVNKSIEIYQKNQILLEKIEKSARTNYSVGKIPQQDIFRAQTEISRLQMRLVMLRQERISLQADINRLLNRSLEVAVITPSELSITQLHHDLTYFYNLIDNRSPQLKAQKRNVEKGRQAVSLSKMDYFPDVDIGATKLRDTEMHTQGYQVMLSATFPLYFLEKQNNAVRESVARYSADAQDFSSTYRDLLFQVKDAFLQAQRSAGLIQLIQHTIIPQATFTFSSGQATYGVGKVDFLTLLNSLLTLQDNELELQNEIVQYEKAITQLEEITGVML